MAASPEEMDGLPPDTSMEDASFSSGSQEDHTDSPNGLCTHLRATLSDEADREKLIGKYKNVVAWNVNRTQDALHAMKRRKISSPSCDTCYLVLSRPLACLECSYAGCWVSGHMVSHLKDSNHGYCVDVKTGTIFCADCDDFIYDPAMESIHLSTVVSAEEKQTKFQVAKKAREPFRQWIPGSKDASALDGSSVLPCKGRRGLLNLGQTCFLNVVLQSFLHNPLLRGFFLSDKHNSALCASKVCMCCEMDKLFAEIFSPTMTPYGPTSLLATTWTASSELSGYSQQDAHEFFISALNQIHTTSRGSTNVSCNCIIHSTFAGQLQSDVKCERCGNVTSTVDPMLDISLELKGKSSDSDNTLASCLRRYTQPEKLAAKEYSCSKCTKASAGVTEASKRLSIRKLPPVLSFQFKRFEHKTTDKSSPQKIDSSIRFPASINMAPYTTLVMTQKTKEQQKENDRAGVSPASYPGPEAMYDYDLFAVINHEGQIDNGHYTNYARVQDEWYRFDDDKVTKSNLGACLGSLAYMCFYVKRHLDYKPYMTPTYVLARETEAVREKEMEQEKERARIKEVEDALLATV